MKNEHSGSNTEYSRCTYKNLDTGEGVVARWARPLPSHPICLHVYALKSQLLHLWSSCLLMHVGKQQQMTQVLGNLPPLWEGWLRSQPGPSSTAFPGTLEWSSQISRWYLYGMLASQAVAWPKSTMLPSAWPIS